LLRLITSHKCVFDLTAIANISDKVAFIVPVLEIKGLGFKAKATRNLPFASYLMPYTFYLRYWFLGTIYRFNFRWALNRPVSSIK